MSEREAVHKWERTHYPSPLAAERIFISFGFNRVGKKDRSLNKIYRSLPVEFEASSQIWVDDPLHWMAVQSMEHGYLQTLLYCSHCSEVPKSWTALSAGWRDLQRVIAMLEVASKKKSPEYKIFRDPREIVY